MVLARATDDIQTMSFTTGTGVMAGKSAVGCYIAEQEFHRS
jgi:hypothetical protein